MNSYSASFHSEQEGLLGESWVCLRHCKAVVQALGLLARVLSPFVLSLQARGAFGVPSLLYNDACTSHASAPTRLMPGGSRASYASSQPCGAFPCCDFRFALHRLLLFLCRFVVACSAWKSCAETDAERLVQLMFRAFQDMMQLTNSAHL